MSELKHIGKMKNGRKVVVAYKTVPNEPDNCIVVATESLDADQHDTLMNLVESNTGQTSFELAEAMARSMLPDGRNMLEAFHTTGKLNKYPTTDIIMTPNTKTSLPLNELNSLIAEQQGVSISDLAIKPDTAQETPVAPVVTDSVVTETEETVVTNTDGVLTDEELAAQYRSQADSLFKEAKRLREQAEELVPTKKKSKTAASE